MEAEQYLLGALMIDPSAFLTVGPHLKVDQWGLEKHKLIYRRMLDLAGRNEPIDRVTVANELNSHGELQSVDGVSYLARLDDGMPQLALYNLETYCKIVIEKHRLRVLMHRAQNAYETAAAQCLPADEIAGALAGHMLEIQKGGGEDTGLTSLEATALSYGTNALLDPSSRSPGLSTGFTRLDEMTGGGLRAGELTVLAARPAMGKTSFALNIAAHVACHPKNPKAVAVFSLEMSKESLFQRLLCSQARVDQNKQRAGYLSQEDRLRLQEALAHLSDAPIFIDDTAAISPMDIHGDVLRLQQDKDVGLVIIDYLQLMQGSGRRENRQQDVSDLSRGLKIMSKELRLPFLVLSQLSRAPEQRQGDHRPILSDLRESGCLPGDTLIPDAVSGRRIPIRDIQPGTAVWALNQQTLKLELTQVSNAFSTGVKRVFTLKTRLGRTIRATANHKFMAFSGWTELYRLKKGERIALPRIIPASQNLPTIEEDKLRLLGHLIGNGCILPSHCIQYTTADPELAELVRDLAKRCFGDEVNPYSKQERSWIQTYLKSTRRHTRGKFGAIRLWLQSLGLFGKRSHEKFVPAEVFAQSAGSIATFLAHLWTSDGCICSRRDGSHPTVYYGSCSAVLARDVQALLLRLGINARLAPSSQMAKGRAMHYVEISGKGDLLTFCNLIGGIGSKRSALIALIRNKLESTQGNTNRDVIPKEAWPLFAKRDMKAAQVTERQLAVKLGMAYCGATLYKHNLGRLRALRVAAAIQSETLRRLAESDVYWDEVASIEYSGEEQVYDLTIPEHHNFVGDDIIAHNSIEQDSDNVQFIFREEVYRPDKESLKGIAEIILAKQRNGPTGRVKLAFLNKFTKFENLAMDLGEESEASSGPGWRPSGGGLFVVPDGDEFGEGGLQ